MTVTLVMGNKTLRLATFTGSRIESWDDLTPPSDCLKDGVVLQPQILAAYLKTYFSSHNLSSQQIRLGIRGISIIYRRLKLPCVHQNKIKEAVERAICKEVNLELNEYYLDWRITGSTEKEMNLMVLGVSRPIIDSIFDTFKMAGLNLVTIDLNAFALTRAAGKETALIIDLENDSTDIIIINRGIPETLHTYSVKNEHSSFEDNLNLMQDELNRTIDFFTLTHPEIAIGNDTPLLLCGSFSTNQAEFEHIREFCGRTIETIAPNTAIPPGFPAGVFAANLGLLPQKPYILPMTNRLNVPFNFIQARQRTLRKPLQIKKIAFSAGIALAVLIFIPELLIHNQSAAETRLLREQLSSLTSSLSTARDAQQQNLDISNSIQTLNASTSSLNKERQQLSGKGPLDLILSTLINALPPGTIIERTTSTSKEIILEGTSLQYADVIDYIHELEHSGLFSDIRITSMEQSIAEEQTPECQFQLNIQR
jgi:Tfp pilus assembly PilM family ATPase